MGIFLFSMQHPKAMSIATGSNKARRRISFHQRSHTPEGTVQKWKTLWTIQSILSSKGLNYLTESDLIKEEGFFDEDGLLADEQVKFYPKTQRLYVVLPGNDRIEFSASRNGFSRAIDTARQSILEMPAFRNPEKKPN